MRMLASTPRLIDITQSLPISEQVTDAIVSLIAAGEIQPGARLIESELALRFATSRVPVREALRTLQTQGIAESSPVRGLQVAPFDDAQIRRVAEARYALELIVTREAMRRLRDAPEHAAARLAAPLREAIAIMQRYRAPPQRLRLNQADIAFHRALCTISGNQVVAKLWEGLSRHVLIGFGRMAHRYVDSDRIVAQHDEFLKFLLYGAQDDLPRELANHVGGLVDPD